jgi:hypothetical protein
MRHNIGLNDPGIGHITFATHYQQLLQRKSGTLPGFLRKFAIAIINACLLTRNTPASFSEFFNSTIRFLLPVQLRPELHLPQRHKGHQGRRLPRNDFFVNFVPSW